MKPSDDIYHEDSVPALARKDNHRTQKRKKKSSGSHSSRPRIPGGADNHYPRRPAAVHRSRRKHKQMATDRARLLVVGALLLLLLLYLGWLFYSMFGDSPVVLFEEEIVISEPVDEAMTEAAPQLLGGEALIALIDAERSVEQRVAKIYSLIEKKDYSMAKQWILESLETMPGNVNLKKMLVTVCLAAEQYGEALEHVLDVLERTPKDVEARIALVNVLTGLHDDAAVVVAADWLLEAQPYSIDAHFAAARAYLNLDRAEPAISHLRRILSIDRDHRPAQSLLGIAYRKQRAFGKAIRLFQEQMKRDDQDSMLFYNLAVCYAELGDTPQSVEWLQRAADLFGNSFVSTWLESADFDRYRTEEAFQHLSESLSAGTN